MKARKLFCHGRDDRSFHFRNHKFPICARCTGIYLSAFLYLFYGYVVAINYTMMHVYVACILIIPCAVDGFTQLFQWRESNNTLRFVTGFMAGIGMMMLIRIVTLVSQTLIFGG